MGILDWVLNLLGLLLWLSFWAGRIDPLYKPPVRTLIGTLKPAEPRKRSHANVLVALAVLLVGRAVLYQVLARAIDQPATLDTGTLTLVFRPGTGALGFLQLLSYSVVSFLFTFACAHLWLAFLTAINYREGDQLLYLRLLRFYLRRVARIHPLAQIIAGIFFVAITWLAIRPILIWAGALPTSPSTTKVALQTLVVTTGCLLSLRYLAAIALGAYFITQYAYLGQPAWLTFLVTSGKNILRPLERLPLRIGQFDMTAIAALVLILGVGEFLRQCLHRLLPI